MKEKRSNKSLKKEERKGELDGDVLLGILIAIFLIVFILFDNKAIREKATVESPKSAVDQMLEEIPEER